MHPVHQILRSLLYGYLSHGNRHSICQMELPKVFIIFSVLAEVPLMYISECVHHIG